MKNFKQLREGLSTKSLLRREKELNLKLKELKIRAALKAEKDSVQEGTWSVPDSPSKLRQLQKVLDQKNVANTVKQVEKFKDQVYNLFGDDTFFDFLDLAIWSITGKRDDGGEIKDYHKTTMLKHGIGKGMDLNALLMRELTRWTNGVMTFKGNKIATVPSSWMKQDESKTFEGKKRGRGNIKFNKSEPVRFEETEEE